jgi:hypothetical protein
MEASLIAETVYLRIVSAIRTGIASRTSGSCTAMPTGDPELLSHMTRRKLKANAHVTTAEELDPELEAIAPIDLEKLGY